VDCAVNGHAEKCVACSDCHSAEAEKAKPALEFDDLDHVDTDRYRVRSFGRMTGAGEAYADALEHVLCKLESAHNLSDEAGCVPGAFLARTGYVLRPLRGIWATAPYLHNGSVPTLADLLKPPNERPKHFCIGNRAFDEKSVGYIAPFGTDCKTAWRFDVTEPGSSKDFVPGNSNQGHEYGTNLKPDEKAALIEYLKSL
jgi:hypothetical protein